MCGIVGFVEARPISPEAAAATLARMTDALAHRGPDGRGFYTDGPAGVALGHRRLSIIDLVGGAQPLGNEDGSIQIVFNGEIYNFADLGRRLRSAGHRFATRGDTETLVHAYEEWGVDALSQLDGMFAFVLYDQRRRRLFGARDPLGKKPLYLRVEPGSPNDDPSAPPRFAFASEPAALFRHPALAARRSLSPAGLRSYLLHDYVLGRDSIYHGVDRLRPGEAFFFDLDDGRFQTWSHWKLDYAPADADRPATRDDAARKVYRLTTAAVAKRRVADVPLGVFLSGGIDSSTVAALLTQFRPAAELDTFAVGFDETSFDESAYAARVAAELGTRHHARRFTTADLSTEAPRLAASLDEPLADPSLLPVALLSAFARETVTVALGGDGGDELFGGYDPFRALTPAGRYESAVPRWAHRRLVAPAAALLPSSDGNMAFDFKVNRFLRGLHAPPGRRLALWMGAFSPVGLSRLAPDLAADDAWQHPAAFGAVDQAAAAITTAGFGP
ncbi:MAG: asparagine synthase (glutamine-hydrolyzing), partial [Planctomycetia bacterium]